MNIICFKQNYFSVLYDDGDVIVMTMIVIMLLMMMKSTMITMEMMINNYIVINYPISGGYYQNETGQIYGCKQCNNGTFVLPDNRPGTALLDCSVCPIGTNKDAFAGQYACPCLSNYTRRYRFGHCDPCPAVGIYCNHEIQQVNKGYYWTWEWPNVADWKQNLKNYTNFFYNIRQNRSNFDAFNGTIPRSHPCPLGNRSCSKIGINPSCEKGYTGWLCTECESSSSWNTSYFSGFQKCVPCPPPWNFALTSTVLFLMLIVLFIIIWKSTQNRKSKPSVLDRLLAQFKILLGFYQVIGAMFSALESIHWPDKLSHIASTMEILQLNILRVFVKPTCYFKSLKFNAYHEFIIALSFVGVICLTAFMWYVLRIAYLRVKYGVYLHRSTYARDTRMICFVFTIVILFITYPSVCSVTLALLPTGCDTFYLDENNRYYVRRLRADYSIDCDKDIHRSYMSAAFAALLYIVGFPVFLFILLWKHRRHIFEMKASKDARCICNKSVQTDNTDQINENEVVDPPIASVAAYSINVSDRDVENIDDNNNENYEANLQDNVDDVSVEDYDLNFEADATPKENTFPVWLLFLCENYKAEFWYWEIFEITRKLLQISVLTMFGSSDAWYLSVTVAVSLVYLTSYVYCKPISNRFEHALHITSLLSISLNLLVATSLKMSENNSMKKSDSAVVTITLVVLNVGVLLAVVGK